MANQEIEARIRFRRDNSTNWASLDPVLAEGEPGYCLDSRVLKIGDGTSTWSELPSYTQVLASQITLLSSGWSAGSQTVTATGVSEDNVIIVNPDLSSAEEYVNCGVFSNAQGINSLTFTSVSTPASNLLVNLIIFMPNTLDAGFDTSDATATAAHILSGATAYISTGKVAGTYVPLDTSDATAISGDIISGKTAYVNGTKLTGTYVPLDTSDANATAGDIRSGKSAYVNGTKINGNLVPLDTSDANAVAGDIRTGKTAYVNGSKITGTATIGGMTDLCGTLTLAGTYATSTYVIAASCYMACDADGNIILMFKGGTSTTYENINFALGTVPQGWNITLGTSTGAWSTSNPAGNFFCARLSGITAKVNIQANFGTRATGYSVATLNISVA